MDAQTSLERRLEITSLLYQSVLEPSCLRVALQAFDRGVEGSAAQTYTVDRSTGQILYSETDEQISAERNRQYQGEWGSRDPRARLMARVASGSVLRCHDYFDERFVARNAFYQEFFIPNGFRWALGGCMHHDDGTSTVLAALRAPDQDPFSHDDVAFAAGLLPHVQRVFCLKEELGRSVMARTGLDGVLASMPHPCVVTDSTGRILATGNGVAGVLHEVQGSIHHGRLRFQQATTHCAWLLKLASVTSTGIPGWLHVPGLTDEHEMTLLPWSLLRDARDAVDRQVLLVQFAPRRLPRQRAIAAVAAQFALTKAEAAVLACLAAGKPAKQIATERGSSVATVRSQIASILQKAGCRSQRELHARYCM